MTVSEKERLLDTQTIIHSSAPKGQAERRKGRDSIYFILSFTQRMELFPEITRGNSFKMILENEYVFMEPRDQSCPDSHFLSCLFLVVIIIIFSATAIFVKCFGEKKRIEKLFI